MMMDLTLHDSSSQFEEDLALITGNSQTSSTARQHDIIVNSNDDDDNTLSDVHKFSLSKVTGSDNEIVASEEEFGETVSYDKSDSIGSDMEVYSDSGRKVNKQILNGNKKEVNNYNHVLNYDESDDIIENAASKKRGSKRKRSKPEACSVSNTEGSTQSKRLLVYEREQQECKLTDQRKCGKLEENYDRDNESENANSMETRRMKTKEQNHDVVSITSDEAVACNVVGRDEGVGSVCEEDAGDIVGKKVEEYWEDIYGRTRDKQGRVIQVRIYW